jgi:hypothetical protein
MFVRPSGAFVGTRRIRAGVDRRWSNKFGVCQALAQWQLNYQPDLVLASFPLWLRMEYDCIEPIPLK